MSNYKAVISYDGTDFSGVAEQNSVDGEQPIRTVIGELRPIIAMVMQHEPKIVVSGRTDKGVHAREQVISFSFDEDVEIDCNRLVHVCNRKLNPEVIIHSIVQVEESFNARFSAKSRCYRYFILNSPEPDFTLDRYSWHIYNKLNIDVMKLATQYFVGEQDFSSVCKKDKSISHNIREVISAQFIDTTLESSLLGGKSNLLCFEIKANAFCWNMVRSIVGILVDVGRDLIALDDVKPILAIKDRSHNCTLAPSSGLFLWHIEY